MSFINDVNAICKKTQLDAESWNWDDFPDIYEIGNSITLEDFKKGTKLEKFENEIKNIMDATSLEYKLEFVSAVDLGECEYKFNYVLSWYDGKLNTKKIKILMY